MLRDESVATAPDSGSEEEEVVDEDEPLSSIEQRQSESSTSSDNTLGGRSTTPSSQRLSSLASLSPRRTSLTTPIQSTSLAIRKRAVEQAARLTELDAKRQRSRRKGTADTLGEAIEMIS